MWAEITSVWPHACTASLVVFDLCKTWEILMATRTLKTLAVWSLAVLHWPPAFPPFSSRVISLRVSRRVAVKSLHDDFSPSGTRVLLFSNSKSESYIMTANGSPARLDKCAPSVLSLRLSPTPNPTRIKTFPWTIKGIRNYPLVRLSTPSILVLGKHVLSYAYELVKY